MPGFDGTGPHGMGPMTGGGRGYCAIRLPRTWPRYQGQVAYPYGRRWGGLPFGAAPATPEDELEALRGEAQTIHEQLEQIEARIAELEAG